MQIVYQMEVNGEFDYEKQSIIEESLKVLKEKQAIRTLLALREHRKAIDRLIAANIDNWKIERLAKTDLAILRTAVCEICYLDEIPESVSINEAVEMAKKYGDPKSYAFINSVLGRISRSKSDA